MSDGFSWETVALHVSDPVTGEISASCTLRLKTDSDGRVLNLPSIRADLNRFCRDHENITLGQALRDRLNHLQDPADRLSDEWEPARREVPAKTYPVSSQRYVRTVSAFEHRHGAFKFGDQLTGRVLPDGSHERRIDAALQGSGDLPSGRGRRDARRQQKAAMHKK